MEIRVVDGSTSSWPLQRFPILVLAWIYDGINFFGRSWGFEGGFVAGIKFIQ